MRNYVLVRAACFVKDISMYVWKPTERRLWILCWQTFVVKFCARPQTRMWPWWANNHTSHSPAFMCTGLPNEQLLACMRMAVLLPPLPYFKPVVLSCEILRPAPTSVRIIHHSPG